MTARSQAEGYTLLELLVVMLIIAMAAGLAVALAPGGSSSMRLAAQARKVEAAIDSARNKARLSGQPVHLYTDGGGHALMLGNNETVLELSGDTAAVVKPTLADPSPGAALTFYPDGTNSGGTVHLQSGEQIVEVSIDWLTGKTRVR